MINVTEFRVGNLALVKQGVRISRIALSSEQLVSAASMASADFFPIVLKPEVLEQCGFVENKNYPLYPQRREFSLVLPLPGPRKQEILGYFTANGECFARMAVEGAVCSQNVHQLHQLQNLYFFVTGQELAVRP